jgi:hypothetical protein
MIPAMPAYERPRPRVEGNVIRIETEFATRLRMLVIWEARRAARQAVIRKLKAEGRIKLAYLSASEITQLADAHLRAHAAELLAQAEASSIVRDLKASESVRKDQRNRTLALQAQRNLKEIQQ